MKYVLDVETSGLLSEKTIDYSSFPYKLRDSFKLHLVRLKNIETGEKHAFHGEKLKDLAGFLKGCKQLIFHNGISYDMRVLQLALGIDFHIDYDGNQDWLMGEPCRFTDTLVFSRLLNPDRDGGHSLESWGERLGFPKTDYKATYIHWRKIPDEKYVYVEGEEWLEYNPVMDDYCNVDIELTHKVYEALLQEAAGWDWRDAYKLEKVTAYIVSISEHFGFWYDQDLARQCLIELSTEMARIATAVEPLLPPKAISKTAAKKVMPPKKQINQDGSLSALMQKFIFKHKGTLSVDNKKLTIDGKTYKLPMPLEPLHDKEPMTLADQDDLKRFLVASSWNPSNWDERDLTIDTDKKKVSKEKFEKRVERYVEETIGSEYESFRCEKLDVQPSGLKKKLLKHNLSRPLKVLTNPKFTINADKELCPNLEKLGEQAGFIKDVVKWLIYRHRKNSILSENGTGFLANVRKDDGRIPTPANTCGASSHRFQHSLVCNIARVTSVYGDKMRAQFGAVQTQLGYDFSGLEARVEAHYTRKYPGGEEYIVDLLAEKPRDVHQRMAEKINLTRTEAKTCRYSLGYGAQPPKLARTNGWDIERAKKVFDDFWEAAKPLKLFKERLTAFWKTKGEGKYVVGLSGAKLWSRSEHSLTNLIFQNAGITLAKRANMIHHQKLHEQGLLFNPFKDSSMKGKACLMIHYHDEAAFETCDSLAQYRYFDSEEKAKDFLNKQAKKVTSIKKVDDKWRVGYNIVGHLAHEAVKETQQYYKLRIDLDCEYEMGKSWAIH